MTSTPSLPRQGWVDGVRDGWLTGWAYDPTDPDVPLQVTLVCGGEASGVTLADRYRADVQAAGHGEGCCGFTFRIDPEKMHDARVLWRDTGEALPGRLRPPRRDRSLRRRFGTFSVRVDWPAAGEGVLSGYALRRRAPRRRLEVGLRTDGAPATAGRATRWRPDALGQGGDGFHGFRLSLAGVGAARSAELVEIGTGRILVRLQPAWRRACGLA